MRLPSPEDVERQQLEHDAKAALPEYPTAVDLEQFTGTPASTWRYWAHIGSGPPSFKLGRRRVWKKSAVLEWLQSLDDSAYEDSATREQVWSDFNDLVELIRRLRVRVPAALVGGSFVTDKTDPSDVDAALFIDMSRITRADTFAKVEKIVANPKVDLSLQVDAFLIHWHPDGTQLGAAPRYVAQRGTWDDFWQRKVAEADRNPPQRSHAMPVRGYLEVILDGYR